MFGHGPTGLVGGFLGKDLKRYLGLMRNATTSHDQPEPSKYIYRLTFTHFYGK